MTTDAHKSFLRGRSPDPDNNVRRGGSSFCNRFPAFCKRVKP